METTDPSGMRDALWAAMDQQVPTKQHTELAVGDSIGPWLIEGELGRGGMSVVYAVVHAEIGKRAALKVVHEHVLSPEFPAEKVLLEAQVVNRIAHASIVDIFENGTLPDGRPFLVMERLYGCSLEQQLARGRLTADEVIGIVQQICAALTAAHAARIVHCDLKPENVFLLGEEDLATRKVKLLDWGIARVVTPRSRSGRAEMAVGTPRYISPEQIQGKEPIPASDIYSLGVMAYELFLEEQLFVADSTLEILKQHLSAEPPPPEDLWPGIPAALSELLLSMLAKKPEQRPTAVHVANTLAAVRDELRRRSASLVLSELSGPVAQSGGVITAPAIDLSSAGVVAAPLNLGPSGSAQYARPASRPGSSVAHLFGAVGGVVGNVVVDAVGAVVGAESRRATTGDRLEPDLTEQNRKKLRRKRRRGGLGLMSAAGAIALVATISAAVGYYTARDGGDGRSATVVGAQSALSTVVGAAGAVDPISMPSGPAAAQVGAPVEALAQPAEVVLTSAVLPATEVVEATLLPDAAVPGVRKVAAPVAKGTREARLAADAAKNARDARAAAAPGRAGSASGKATGRRAAPRLPSLDGTIEPY